MFYHQIDRKGLIHSYIVGKIANSKENKEQKAKSFLK